MEREYRRRVNLTFKPSAMDAMRSAAKAEKTSISKLVERLAIQYIEEKKKQGI